MNKILIYGSLLTTIVFCFGCNDEAKDRGIKGDIASRAKEEIAFAGVTYTVKNDTVYLSGICPSVKEKEKVESTINKIAGVRHVENAIQIAPVVLDQHFWLRQAVDSLVKNYPQVIVQMNSDTAVLTGAIKKKQHEELLKNISAIPLRSIHDQLSIQ